MKDATSSAATITAWWRKWPNANVAIATGLGSGVDVLDVDGDAGRAALRDLEMAYGDLPFTVMAQTGKGAHYFFAHDPRVWNRVSLAQGIDVRTEGGYVVAAPSEHVSGRFYSWLVPPSYCDPAPWPEWLVQELLALRETKARPVAAAPISFAPVEGQTTYTARVIESCLGEMQGANVPNGTEPGGRNDTLNRTAYILGQLAGTGEPIGEALLALKQVAAAKGLSDAEIAKTADRAFAAGLGNPKKIRLLAQRQVNRAQ